MYGDGLVVRLASSIDVAVQMAGEEVHTCLRSSRVLAVRSVEESSSHQKSFRVSFRCDVDVKILMDVHEQDLADDLGKWVPAVWVYV